ncbi:m-AAA protease-interacting protein 1, mitochondrial [Nelusetta ayraudi]|uniref:m-AAA protease-interacting protein 1, mitochondrial n=1 Tax=Nelusetta ayraudi TaxID=303726 RepID=UPI003F728CA3
MQRIPRLAACRELGLRAWTPGPPCCSRRWAGTCVSLSRAFTRDPGEPPGRRLSRRRFVFASQSRRLCSSQPEAGGTPGKRDGQPAISVVGIPDPMTWIHCRVQMLLTRLLFGLDTSSDEFHRGVKQALVHVSDLMSTGRYHRMVGVVSQEMREYVEEKCKTLTGDQRKQLAVMMDDIVFLLPEDVSVVFDEEGRKFCFVVMRFWILTTHSGLDDPEATKIFRVASGPDGGPPKRIATAVYEFKRDLSQGASPGWMVTTIWHWQWEADE